jgi:hypothetical protein
MTAIDLSPLLQQLLELLAVALLVMTTWIANSTRKWVGEKNSELLGARLKETIKNGIAYGVNHIEKEKPTINVKDSITAYAAQYVIDRVPDTLKHFNITQDSLAKMIEARLGFIEVSEASSGGAVGAQVRVQNRHLLD